ncbi:PH domain-containing protein [Actinocorallia sp. API 0066]|uniref:PH domain-containing protein n=1 Tax=Actinocorallia sp. API 0066 TaxID=2896846 RepID=UPI001E453B0C|nr:PH domain-containing protein [Actinocorallia sp. API 0066]MCD0449180.1 PH domain-containing protein [Actinocorallia sp. API 0066]
MSSDDTRPSEPTWQRLNHRVIWVDLLWSLLALTPGAVALFVVGAKPSNLVPWAIVAALGLFGAGSDMLRWTFTRYRVTDQEVQRRTGVFVRRYRAVRRDRIRSVDTHARLRHRIAGLRVVTIGAGQQLTTGQSAFVLDALAAPEATLLRATLMGESEVPAPRTPAEEFPQAPENPAAQHGPVDGSAQGLGEVGARLGPENASPQGLGEAGAPHGPENGSPQGPGEAGARLGSEDASPQGLGEAGARLGSENASPQGLVGASRGPENGSPQRLGKGGVRVGPEDGSAQVGEAGVAGARGGGGGEGGAPRERVTVLARLRPWWVVYNVVGVWAYAMAAGLLWGLYWFVSTFGIDLWDVATGLADRASLGPVATAVVAFVAVGVFGAAGMAVSFFTTNWGLELARVATASGSALRTRRGLFTTREVNRDEARMRGILIREPLLWRWAGMSDTQVITTGLQLYSMAEPATILPRGPVGVARAVSAAVLGVEPSPLTVPLTRHPRAALRRRLWWATLLTAVIAAFLAAPVLAGVVPPLVLWCLLGLWPLTLLLAVAAYRSLGHTVSGAYVVARSGLVSRSTSALRRDAVSTIALRESILQRRLGLTTVSTMTAAGWGVYATPDLDAHEAVSFASTAAPGLLDPFLEPSTPTPQPSTPTPDTQAPELPEPSPKPTNPSPDGADPG